MNKFSNRREAGKLLSEPLKAHKKNPNTIVLALLRGGVPVGYEIAKALCLPLDIFVVRKLGVPGAEELAMGAIATGGEVIFNEDIVQQLNISKIAIDEIMQTEKDELERREMTYRGEEPFPTLKGKDIILVDDGATGATMRAAIKALRAQNPAGITVAVPVAALSTFEELKPEVEDFICLLKPIHFYAVGMWYEDFSQTSDSEVSDLLQRAKKYSSTTYQ